MMETETSARDCEQRWNDPNDSRLCAIRKGTSFLPTKGLAHHNVTLSNTMIKVTYHKGNLKNTSCLLNSKVSSSFPQISNSTQGVSNSKHIPSKQKLKDRLNLDSKRVCKEKPQAILKEAGVKALMAKNTYVSKVHKEKRGKKRERLEKSTFKVSAKNVTNGTKSVANNSVTTCKHETGVVKNLHETLRSKTNVNDAKEYKCIALENSISNGGIITAESINESNSSKENDHVAVGAGKQILYHDHKLPPGWRREIRRREVGLSQVLSVCIIGPDKRRFYRRHALNKYLKKMASPLDAEQFNFALYKTVEPGANNPVDADGFPIGWKKTHSAENGSDVTEFISPDGKVLKNRRALRDFLRRESSPYNVQQFFRTPSKPVIGSPSNTSGSPLKTVSPLKTGSPSKAASATPTKIAGNHNLPAGWRRIVSYRKEGATAGRKVTMLLAPNGRRFDRLSRLKEYLRQTKSPLKLEQFIFKPRKQETFGEGGVKPKPMKELRVILEPLTWMQSAASGTSDRIGAMRHDPTLPTGWSRKVGIRNGGQSAGRLEVFIYSPDGKRHRSKSDIRSYIQLKNLPYDAEDFDFSVHGRNTKVARNNKTVNLEIPKKKKEETESDTEEGNQETEDREDEEVEEAVMPLENIESRLIREVSSYFISCQLSSVRCERRLWRKKSESERQLREMLERNGGGQLSLSEEEKLVQWVRTLTGCRPDFIPLDQDAAVSVVEATKDFMLQMVRRACPDLEENGLEYRHIAELVERSKGLTPLRDIVPRQISFEEYRVLNRPTQFMSFTN